MAASQLSAQSLAPRISSEITNSERAALKGSLHPMAQARFDAGRVPAATKLSGISLVFSRSAEQQADLDALIAAQQDPSSPLYHQWLNPDQFAARFGMADDDLDKVKNWLQQQGFSVDSVARSRNMIRFSGTMGQVERAFSTQMHYYTVEGKQHFAPSTELSLPAALAPVVLAVRNLNDFRLKPMLRRPARPDFTSSQSGYVHFAPGDIKIAYNIPSTYTGTGQAIALMGQSAIVPSDIENFQSASGLAVKDPIEVLVPGSGTSTAYEGDESESDIDIEWSGAIANGANIIFVYVGDDLNYGVFDSIVYAVDEDIAPIISVSYGGCEAENSSDITSMENVLENAVSQGQTIIVSSGDSGSTACYGDYGTNSATTSDEALAVNYPASSAYVTAMGGTEITAADDVTGTGFWEAANGADVLTSALQWIPEVAWNDDALSSQSLTSSEWASALSSTGGGVSTLVDRPSWQTGVTGIPSGTMRTVPDIALYSSPNYPGYLFCSSDTKTGIDGSCANGFRDADDQYLTVAGGTSFAAPVFAGMVAILNQAKGYTNGQGLVNQTLYKLAADSTKYASAFHDVTAGSSAGTLGVGNECLAGSNYCSSSGESEFPTTTGYDQATGLGSVNLANLIAVWPASSSTLIGTTTTISASNTSPNVGASVTFTITVVAASGTAPPTGNVNLSIDGGGTAYSDGGTTTTVALVASGAPGTATATYQTSFSTVAAHQIVAQFAQDAPFAASTGVVQVNVEIISSGKGSFALAASPGTLTVVQDGEGTETIQATPSGGYTGAVDLTPSSATLSFCYTPATAYVTGTSAAAATMIIDTNLNDCSSTGAQKTSGKQLFLAGSQKAKLAYGASPSIATAAFSFAGLFFAGLIGWRRRQLRILSCLIVLGVMSFALTACGGGGGGSTNCTTCTTTGSSYTITVTGQDSATATITGETTFTLTVQ
jgi:subtilase family serine protease